MIDFLYLHGFASGPNSRKAHFFAAKLAAQGVILHTPDLAAGNFQTLTLTAQLAVIQSLHPRVLIGSSLGGYLAGLHAARSTAVERLVLLAPAFGFAQLLLPRLFGPAGLDQWRARGTAPVFHYATGREEQIGYQLFEDAAQFESFPDFRQPAQIFHGLNDTVVPIGMSREFAVHRPNVSLHPLDSDHQLLNALDGIWTSCQDFLFPRAPW